MTNNTVSAVKGAVVGVLRREAWLGHSYVEGRPLIESVMKMLRLTKDEIKPLIAQAVTDLAMAKVVHASSGQLQLLSLHEAETKLAGLVRKWAALDCKDAEDLVPTEKMGTKLLKPLGLENGTAKTLSAGLRSLLGERFALIQCETLSDQMLVIKGLQLFLKAFGADAIYSAYTNEMADEVKHRGVSGAGRSKRTAKPSTRPKRYLGCRCHPSCSLRPYLLWLRSSPSSYR